MREFRHLSPSEITEIVSLFRGGATKSEIAARYGVDRSTIFYHLKKLDTSLPEDRSFYASLKVQVRRVCHHPSSRCTVCGEMFDEIRREERGRIMALEEALARANARLRLCGEPVEYAR